MADIYVKILNEYGIDIAQDNIIKLYRIDSEDISSQELEEKIKDTRKRWNTSINGANEKNAERDRKRIEKADKYEAILRDEKYRKELIDYYNKSNGPKGSRATSEIDATDFAREYFKLVATTKKIKKSDVDFFFRYYQSERKNKKAIIEMLSKEMKIIGLGKEDKYVDEIDEDDIEGKKKKRSSVLIVNLFQEATVIKIRRAIEKYEEASRSDEVCGQYPNIRNGFFDFLEIKDIDDAKQYTEKMAKKSKEVYAIRQERGTEYIPLVDMFNILQDIGEYQDVVDNIPEFKLLLKYPNLTPYMFSFVEMKPATIKGLFNIANRDYVFRDDTDFILNYYKPIHDNFGISDSGIGALLRKAEKKTNQNKILNSIDEKLGRTKKKRKISIGAEILHWLVYWPIFVIYLVFEIAKAIFTELHKFTIPVFVLSLFLMYVMVKVFDTESLFALKKIFFKNQWLSFLKGFVNESGNNVVETFLLSLLAIVKLLAINLLAPLFLTLFVSDFSEEFNKRFDWCGIERTFQQIFQKMRKNTEEQFFAHKMMYVKKSIKKAFINIASLAILIAIIIIAPIGFKKFSETTGYFQKESSSLKDEEDMGYDLNNLPEGTTMIITESSANVRSGPGTEYGVVSTVNQGDLFITTGNQENKSDGNNWYEIYLDDEKTLTGWASQKVIGIQENDDNL